MKLNLGCGKDYKEGFVNIDAFDSTVADKIMPVENLDFSSNSIEEIQAIQLIEHLGSLKTIYALAEWFRVLKPGGILVLETPDLEKSFKQFLEGDIGTRKKILTWIYGVEIEGMSHLFCFPTDLIEMLLNKTGFIDIEKSDFEFEKNHPTLRIYCKKPKDDELFQTISHFRKELIKNNIVDINSYYVTREQENLIDFFILKMKEFIENNDLEILNEIVMEGGIRDPQITYTFISESANNKIVNKQDAEKHIKVSEFLVKISYPSLLLYLLKESPTDSGVQNKTFQTIINIGKQSIFKMLSSEDEKSKLQDSLIKLSKESDYKDNIFFSDEIIQREAEIFFKKGLKEFIKSNFKEAIQVINESIKLDRNHILYYWNQGRLHALTRDNEAAKSSYENALKLAKMSDYKDKKNLIKKLEKEKNEFLAEKYGKPILVVEDDFE